jgi:polyisoprenoid-binding protein YceI
MAALKMTHMRKMIPWLVASLLCFIPAALADAPAYDIVADKSSLKFIATQNNAPLQGTFKQFTARILFDPAQLDKSSIDVEIDLASLHMADMSVAQTLAAPEWFAAKDFPKAIYKASVIKHVKDNQYIAEGELTLKNRTLPVALNFTMEKMDDTSAIAHGSASILRNDFMVGEGEWATDGSIKNEVRVEFHITAQKL